MAAARKKPAWLEFAASQLDPDLIDLHVGKLTPHLSSRQSDKGNAIVHGNATGRPFTLSSVTSRVHAGARTNQAQRMDGKVLENEIFALTRPDPALWKCYILRAILGGPAVIVLLPYLYFRYHTLQYRFDNEGIHMKVGILFRREVNLTYARIQDIHLNSGIIQRWLGLADVQVQTASGSTGPELVIEGFNQYDKIRDFLYTRMRGYQSNTAPAASSVGTSASSEADPVALLRNIRDELARTRELIEKQRRGQSGQSNV